MLHRPLLCKLLNVGLKNNGKIRGNQKQLHELITWPSQHTALMPSQPQMPPNGSQQPPGRLSKLTWSVPEIIKDELELTGLRLMVGTSVASALSIAESNKVTII